MLALAWLLAGCSGRTLQADSGPDGGPSARTGGASDGRPQGGPGTVVADPADEASVLFDQQTIRSYNILIAPADLALIDADPTAETYVDGTLELDGQRIGPVGVRYKGSVGAFLTPCTSAAFPGSQGGAKTGKCSIKVSFDHTDPEGRYLGLKKLNFHSMNRDPSMLRERLAYSMFREMGIAAPRAMHARLSINGRLEGLFVVVEQIDGRFTRSRFTEGGEGNLYKEIWPMHDSADAYRAALETNRTGAPPVDRMLDFTAATRQGSAAVERFLDRKHTARYIAVDRVILNDDGAFHWWCAIGGQGNNPGGIGNHNYYWYEASSAERLWIIPWDLDSSFRPTSIVHIEPEWTATAACTCAGVQRPASCDPLFAVWAGWREDYDAAIDEFVTGPFEAGTIEQTLALWSLQIQTAVAEAAGLNGAPTLAAWEADVASLHETTGMVRQSRGYPY